MMFVNYPIAGNITIAGCHLGRKYHYFIFTEPEMEPESRVGPDGDVLQATAEIDPKRSFDNDGKLFLQLLSLYTFISHRGHD